MSINNGVTYILEPTKQPKYSCKRAFSFHTGSEKACGLSIRTEQPF